jgi:hypothetical protein
MCHIKKVKKKQQIGYGIQQAKILLPHLVKEEL